ncbi:MAG TPA: hypothetical protein PKZ57_04435 [Methanoregulaceae archaeon]|nr:hypothetical protein [Bacteroidales bacterium]HQM56734.1 hypothetical protein [Methanoregulaceae archaeon]
MKKLIILMMIAAFFATAAYASSENTVVALTGTRDGKILKFEAGETIWCPQDIDHWHGVSPGTAMTHIAIQEMLDGSSVKWLEKVCDGQYSGE